MSDSPIDQFLANQVASGRFQIGEIVVTPGNDETFELRHHLDTEVDPEKLSSHDSATDARTIGLHDEQGEYRSLKTAPNLKRGWILRLSLIGEVRAALDFFYPAAVGIHVASLGGELEVVPLRSNLERQTGMYRFARKISDDGAQDLVQTACHHSDGCLRRILWPLADGSGEPMANLQGTSPLAQDIPLLCPEACNILVAASRKVSKAEAEAKTAAEDS